MQAVTDALRGDWDILDDWQDDRFVLRKLNGDREFEAQVAWLLRHHCENKEMVTILSSVLGKRVTEKAVKHALERLTARLRVRGRSNGARRMARLVEEYRASGSVRGGAKADEGLKPAEDHRPATRQRV